MAVDDPVRICLDELRGSDEAGAARKMARERRTSLLGRKGFASVLVGVATDGGDNDRERGLELFRALLREAGADARNRGSLGGRFLEEAAASVRALVRKDKLDPDRALDLANAYAQGEVETPAPLVSWLTDWMDALARSEGGAGRLDAEIDRIRQAGDDDHGLFRVVDKWLGLLPARKKAGTVRHIAGRTEDFGGRLALYWLLDAAAEVRLAAAGGVGGRVKTGIAEPGSMSLVPLIRNWMPADAARRPLDGALRGARRRGLFAPLAGWSEEHLRFLGNLPDRSGVQEFAAVVEGDDGPVLALATTRPGRGVERAVVVRGEQARKGVAGVVNAPDTFELSRESLELLLGAALADGLAGGRLAPAGLINVAVACGFSELPPRMMTARGWLDKLDPDGGVAALAAWAREGLVKESATWPYDYPAVRAWHEGTALYRKAMDGAKSGNGVEAAFWALMEQRRSHWALAMLRAAYVLNGVKDSGWRSFAVTAMALLDGSRTLKTIPIMDRIYTETVAEAVR